jgi:ABC-type branched-subunit amino acid transport system ATPase component
VLHDVSLTVQERSLTTILGPNGAGKSTLLRTLAGLLRPTQGEILLKGRPIHGMSGDTIHRRGLAFVSETLNLFTGMSVYENLLLGAYTCRDRRDEFRGKLATVYELFPRLAERRSQLAGTLSGGERKMLAIGRALMGNPSVLLVDEPSLGLAPIAMTAVFETLQRLNAEGLTILLVEQNVPSALAISQYAYVLERGEVRLAGKARELEASPYIKQAYIGVA